MQYITEQENKCLKTKRTIDLLRTQLLMIDDFKEREFYDTILKRLKNKINSIYWNL